MIVIICVAFSIALYIWTVASITYGTIYPMLGYTLGLMLVMLFVVDGYIICSNKRVRQGVMILGVILNLRLSVAYCTWTMPDTQGQDKISRWSMLKSTGLQEVVMVIGVFVLVSLIICHTKIYRIRALNVLLTVVLPMAMVAARLTGKKEDLILPSLELCCSDLSLQDSRLWRQPYSQQRRKDMLDLM